MKILTIDIGNLNICIGCAAEHKVAFVERMHADSVKTDLEYVIGLKMILDLHQVQPDSLDGAIISSVVPPLTDTLSRAVRKLTGLTPMIVGPGLKTGIQILPADTGADLVVGAVAAVQEYGAPAVIIDMGTATTITAVDERKRFLGGVIFPGVELALRSLSSGAAQLPSIQLNAPKKIIATDTIHSMQAGVVYGNAAALDGLLDRMLDELRTPAKIIACGGLAPLIIPHCRHEIVIDDELLLKGLDLLYDRNRPETEQV